MLLQAFLTTHMQLHLTTFFLPITSTRFMYSSVTVYRYMDLTHLYTATSWWLQSIDVTQDDPSSAANTQPHEVPHARFSVPICENNWAEQRIPIFLTGPTFSIRKSLNKKRIFRSYLVRSYSRDVKLLLIVNSVIISYLFAIRGDRIFIELRWFLAQ